MTGVLPTVRAPFCLQRQPESDSCPVYPLPPILTCGSRCRLNYTPSVPKFLENPRVCEELSALFRADGPPAITFYCSAEANVGMQELDSAQRHKLTLTRPPIDEPFIGKCVFFTRASATKGVDVRTLEADLCCGDSSGLPLVALQQAFSHVYQPMVTTYETWGDAGDVHDFVTMVTKFDNFLGFALPWPRCTRHCSV